MTTVKDICDILNSYANQDMAYEWDNCGLNIGNYDSQVNGIMLCVDVSIIVLQEAIEKNCNLIVSHHPALWDKTNKIVAGEFQSDIAIMAIKNNINLFSVHTNLDTATNGINEWLCNKLNFEIIGGYEQCYRVALIKEEINLQQLARKIENVTKDKHIKTIGNLGDKCKKIVISSGSSGRDDELLEWSKQQQIDTFVCGELKYSLARKAQHYNIKIVEYGHYESEWCSKEIMADWLKNSGAKILLSEQEASPYN